MIKTLISFILITIICFDYYWFNGVIPFWLLLVLLLLFTISISTKNFFKDHLIKKPALL